MSATVSPPSNTFAVNAPVTGLRDWSLNPGGDGSFWVTPFQVGANWITSGAMITALRGGNGGSVNVNPNFSVPWVRGTATDPLVQVSDGTKTIHVHIPLGTITEQPIPSAGNQNIGGSDSTQPYLVWSIDNATINTGSVAASGSVITGNNMCINDGSGAVMMDIITGESASGNNSLGAAILDYDLTQANANPNYVIQHMLQYQLDPSFQCNTSAPGPIWPLLLIDTSGGAGSGPLPQGYTIGIPASTPRPTGQTRGFYLLWDQAQQFGMFFYNVGAGGGTNMMVYSTNSANTALVNDIVTSWPNVMKSMCLLDATNGTAGSQYSVTTIKGMVGGVRNDTFPPPPLLDYTPTGGSVPTAAQIAAFGAWYNTSPVYTTPWTPNVPGKHILVSAIASQIVGDAFTVSGTLTGYATPPTLQYQDNQTGSWLPFPGAPAPAAAVGYNTQTFGPAMTLAANPTLPLAGANWAPFNFFGVTWADIVVTTNADGSLTMSTGNMGDGFGGQLCTAVYDPTQPDYFRGMAVGGGAFFEATISFTGTPNITGVSFWANDIESMAGGSEGDLTRRQWPGQAAGYGDWIELDFPEFDTGSTTQYGQGIHNFYGTAASPQDVNTGSYPGFVSPITVPVGTDFSQPHKYGFLWVPATAAAQGSAQWFFDDVQVGTTVHWNQYNPSNAPPPVEGTTAFSVMDTRHFALILGLGSSTNPMTIHAVSVWQASASSNKTS